MKKALYIFAALFFALLCLRETMHVVRAGVSCSVPNTFTNGTTADATQVNANFSALVACFTNSAAAGANSDITSLTGLTTPIAASAGGTQQYWGGTSTGSANAQVITTVRPTSGFTLAVSGNIVCFFAGFTNTGSTTLNVNGTGVVTVNREIQTSSGLTLGLLTGGEFTTSSPNASVCVFYQALANVYVLRDRIDYPGEVRNFAYAGCPTGWLEANGGSFVVANFPDLNTVLGTTWGVAGTLPDLRGRAVFGRDSGGSARITVAGGNFDGTAVGNVGGQQGQSAGIDKSFLKSFALSVTDPGHTHTAATVVTAGGATNLSSGANVNFNNTGITTASNTTGVTVNSGGSGTAFPTLSNAGIVTMCVKL